MLILFMYNLAYASPICGDNNLSAKNIAQIGRSFTSEIAPECQLLPSGTFKDMNIRRKDSLTTVEQKYRLTRTRDGDFEVMFNIQFYMDVKGGNFEIDDKLTREWREKSAECLSRIDGKALGPNGEKLKFRIYDGPQNEEAPPLTEIGMRLEGRAHSHSWTTSLGCPTITHELLHLAGLVDEYPEVSKGYIQDPKTGELKFVEDHAKKTAYDCRKIYSSNSIMANDSIAWTDVMSDWEIQADFCKCSQDDLCKKYFENASKQFEKLRQDNPGKFMGGGPIEALNECPPGFSKGGYASTFSLPEEWAPENKMPAYGFAAPKGIPVEELTQMIPIQTIKRKSPSQKNILEPRHFNAIVYPGCMERNQSYYQDSANAYRTSQRNGGKGCLNFDWMGK